VREHHAARGMMHARLRLGRLVMKPKTPLCSSLF